jgi:hypothetical protein
MANYTPQDHLDEATGLLEHISTQARENGANFTRDESDALSLTSIAHSLAGLLKLSIEATLRGHF